MVDFKVKMMVKSPMITQGHGPPVLLLHASLSFKEQWLTLMKSHTDYQFIAIDLLGYGQNPAISQEELVPQGFSLDQEVEVISKTLTCTDKLTLVGHSYGGAVAMAYALRFPQKVERLILYEPVLFGLLSQNDPGREEIDKLTHDLKQQQAANGWAACAADFVDYWNQPGAFSKLPEALQQKFTLTMPKVMFDFKAITQLSFKLDDIGELSLPIQLLSGERTKLPAKRVIQCLQRLKTVSVSELQGMGHMGPLTHQAKVVDSIFSFLSRNNPLSTGLSQISSSG